MSTSVYGVYWYCLNVSKRVKEKYKVTAVAVSLLIFDDMFEWNLEVEKDTVFSTKHNTNLLKLLLVHSDSRFQIQKSTP